MWKTARAIVRAARHYNGAEPVNLGACREITIRDLVTLVARLTGFRGEIVWDPSKPDGQPRRCLDISRAEREFNFRASYRFRGRAAADYPVVPRRAPGRRQARRRGGSGLRRFPSVAHPVGCARRLTDRSA
jgi:hypothetical protein